MQLKNYLLQSVIMVSFFALTGCQTETLKPTVIIDSSLLPYFERFETEAAQRGVDALVTTLVSGKLTTIDDGKVVGKCEHYTNSPNVILVDQQYWQKASELEKEYLIFHELGHCFLHRSHLDAKDQSGNCLSIMQSGTGACRMNYTYSNRKSYVDELFE